MSKLDIKLNDNGPGMISPSTAEIGRESYPQFHYEGPEELDELGVPEEGTMTVEYCIIRETSTKRPDGSEWYSCDVQLKRILSAKGEAEAPTKSGSEAADALDKLAAEKSDENDGEDY